MHDPITHRHPPAQSAVVPPSLLRLSVAQRLAIAAGLAAVLWAAVAWALLWSVS
ncbi:MAG: hypothetical protein IT539_08910 [Bradyrhizobiaceae bacterium]|nr:hypothetical protein [Bradyrhizobiaceae bacterium]